MTLWGSIILESSRSDSAHGQIPGAGSDGSEGRDDWAHFLLQMTLLEKDDVEGGSRSKDAGDDANGKRLSEHEDSEVSEDRTYTGDLQPPSPAVDDMHTQREPSSNEGDYGTQVHEKKDEPEITPWPERLPSSVADPGWHPASRHWITNKSLRYFIQDDCLVHPNICSNASPNVSSSSQLCHPPPLIL